MLDLVELLLLLDLRRLRIHLVDVAGGREEVRSTYQSFGNMLLPIRTIAEIMASAILASQLALLLKAIAIPLPPRS